VIGEDRFHRIEDGFELLEMLGDWFLEVLMRLRLINRTNGWWCFAVDYTIIISSDKLAVWSITFLRAVVKHFLNSLNLSPSYASFGLDDLFSNVNKNLDCQNERPFLDILYLWRRWVLLLVLLVV
jgi:hypothetical protein